MKRLRARSCARARRRGFSLVEIMIATTILFVLAATLVESVGSLKRLTVTGSVDTHLQTMSEKALRSIIADLKRSGFSAPYPYFFENGAAAGAFAPHAHAAPVSAAQAGDFDFGPNREIVFVQPLDADDTDPATPNPTPDGVPDVDAAGQRVWNPVEFSYVLVTRADGVNYLERRSSGANVRTVAHHVERVTFEDASGAAAAEVPVGAVRVRIWFREIDDRGMLHRSFSEAVVHLKNG